MLTGIICLLAGIIAGILIGRANPKKADIIASYANKVKDEINSIKK